MPRYVAPELAAYRASGKPLVQRIAVFVRARQKADGNPVSGGFWNGSDAAQFEVYDPATGNVILRDYNAAGALLGVEAVSHVSGLDIHPAQVSLSPVNEDVFNQLQAFDLRGAQIELHRLWLDYETRQPIAPGHVWLTGTINKAQLRVPKAGETAELTYTVVPPTRALTTANPDPISDTAQSRRLGDRLFRYVGLAGVREIPWMRGRVTGSSKGGSGNGLLGGAGGSGKVGDHR